MTVAEHDLLGALAVSFDAVRVDRRIHAVLGALEERPELANAVARSRLTLTDFLRSWCDNEVPSKERMTEWVLDWIERRNDQPNEGAMDR